MREQIETLEQAVAQSAVEVRLGGQTIRLRSEAGVGRRADYDQVISRVALAEVNALDKVLPRIGEKKPRG